MLTIAIMMFFVSAYGQQPGRQRRNSVAAGAGVRVPYALIGSGLPLTAISIAIRWRDGVWRRWRLTTPVRRVSANMCNHSFMRRD